MARPIRTTSSSRSACTRCASRSACWWIITFIGTSSLVSLSLIWKILQNQTIIFDNHSTTLCEGASIITTRQRTCLSAFVGMVEELSKWTSQEVAHRPDRRLDGTGQRRTIPGVIVQEESSDLELKDRRQDECRSAYLEVATA